MWGEVLGTVVEALRRPRTEHDHFVDPMCDEVVDYEVQSVVAKAEGKA